MNLIPHDLGAEKNVLGAVLVHPRVLVEVGDLRIEEFYDPRHGSIWSAILELHGDNEPIDAVSIPAVMERHGTIAKLSPIGGLEYFTELMSNVVTVENIGWHGRRLRLLARRRAWLALSLKIAVAARDMGIDSEDFIADAETQSVAMTTQIVGGDGPRRISGVVKDYIRVLEKRVDATKNKTPLTGVASKLHELDDLTGGFQPGDLVVLAARPSMGKTALALNIVAEAARSGHPSLVFSFEMNNIALVERMMARETGIDLKNLKRGIIENSDWPNLTRGGSNVAGYQVWLEENAALTVLDMRTIARQWKAANRITDDKGIVVLDYLQIMSGGDKHAANREREVAFMSRQMKLMAKELRMPVLALSQLSRKCEERNDKRPMLSDLRESGAIEQDADTVMFIYRDDYYDKQSKTPGIAEIIIAKARNGETGTAMVGWDGKHQRFRDAT